MGMERIVPRHEGSPDWSAIQQRLLMAGYPVQMRMIDSMPAFPDEAPEENWRELRLTLGAGMITLRRTPGDYRIVVWGNADQQLQDHQEALAQACA